MNILITGNPNYGIAESLKNIFVGSGNVDFLSPSYNGINLNSPAEILNTATKSLNYDVFINNVRLSNFNQVKLLEAVYNTWTKNNKIGRIINIGSSSDSAREKTWIYGTEKAALRKASEAYAFQCAFRKSNIKVSYVSFGWVSTPVLEKHEPNVKKHSCVEIAELIKWVATYPYNTNINEIRMEPIQ